MVRIEDIAPWGVFALRSAEAAVVGVTIVQRPMLAQPGPDCAVLRAAAAQLREYLAGQRCEFTVPIRSSGTPFQRAVWSAVAEVPYGQTCTYAELARRCGHPRAVRAVAAALARNPVLLMVPCHRVLGQGGALTGYAAGVALKDALLRLEKGGGVARVMNCCTSPAASLST